MPTTCVRIEGSKAAVDELRELIAADPALSISEEGEVAPDIDRDGHVYGMEPEMYLLVVFVGHLGAGITHDLLHAAVNRILAKRTAASATRISTIESHPASGTNGGAEQEAKN